MQSYHGIGIARVLTAERKHRFYRLQVYRRHKDFRHTSIFRPLDNRLQVIAKLLTIQVSVGVY
jgi:hypothetical protein